MTKLCDKNTRKTITKNYELHTQQEYYITRKQITTLLFKIYNA